MKKYITKDKLADFVMKMWDAGIRVETRPSESYVTLWSSDLGKLTHVDVVSADFEDTVKGLITEMNEA